MLYELNRRELIALQDACTVAKARMVENVESYERCANNQHLPKSYRASSARMAKLYHARAEVFEAVRKALDEGREITTMAQAKEALER